MERIFKLLKNKEDFKSVIITTENAQIYIHLNKRYFEPQKTYNASIDYYNGTRTRKLNQTKTQIENIIKNFKIINITQ